MESHKRSEALGGQSGGVRNDGSPLELHNDPMPKKKMKGTPHQEPGLDIGDSEAGLGPMPRAKVY